MKGWWHGHISLLAWRSAWGIIIINFVSFPSVQHNPQSAQLTVEDAAQCLLHTTLPSQRSTCRAQESKMNAAFHGYLGERHPAQIIGHRDMPFGREEGTSTTLT